MNFINNCNEKLYGFLLMDDLVAIFSLPPLQDNSSKTEWDNFPLLQASGSVFLLLPKAEIILSIHLSFYLIFNFPPLLLVLDVCLAFLLKLLEEWLRILLQDCINSEAKSFTGSFLLSFKAEKTCLPFCRDLLYTPLLPAITWKMLDFIKLHGNCDF